MSFFLAANVVVSLLPPVCRMGMVIALLIGSNTVNAEVRSGKLAEAIEAIDGDNPGELGVYVKHLASGETVTHKADRRWYLASTVKLPLAIAVLQAARDGRISLQDEMELKDAHRVDGSGQLLWEDEGTRFSVESLIGHSIENSDSTATDWLMRHLGVEAFNRQIEDDMVAEGLGPFTTILQVRYDAYGELHPDAEKLSNMDYLRIRGAGDREARVAKFRQKLDLDDDQLQVPTLERAFENYYERDLNSGTLVAFGTLLERLARGELLNDDDTRRVLDHTADITTGDKRIQAGLPEGVPFSQKTGTQIERACNVGILYPRSPDDTVVVAACAEKFGDIENAETQFQQLGEALVNNGWLAGQ